MVKQKWMNVTETVQWSPVEVKDGSTNLTWKFLKCYQDKCRLDISSLDKFQKISKKLMFKELTELGQ